MGGGQGLTKPRADRGYHFDVSVWACRVEQGALGNLQELPSTTPLATLPPAAPFLHFPFPSLLMPNLSAPFMSCFIFSSDTLPLLPHLCFTHTQARPRAQSHAVRTHVNTQTMSCKHAPFVC